MGEENFKKKLANILDLPKEIILNYPLISVNGNEDIVVQNYKNLVEYTSTILRINTFCGILKIEGKNLNIDRITSEDIKISGSIYKIEFLR